MEKAILKRSLSRDLKVGRLEQSWMGLGREFQIVGGNFGEASITPGPVLGSKWWREVCFGATDGVWQQNTEGGESLTCAT